MAFLLTSLSPDGVLIALARADEWTDWMNRLQEEEDAGKKHNKGFMDV